MWQCDILIILPVYVFLLVLLFARVVLYGELSRFTFFIRGNLSSFLSFSFTFPTASFHIESFQHFYLTNTHNNSLPFTSSLLYFFPLFLVHTKDFQLRFLFHLHLLFFFPQLNLLIYGADMRIFLVFFSINISSFFSVWGRLCKV